MADYIAGLKALAHTCDFGTTLTDMLRDRFVMGLTNETTQQLLLAEADLTFNKAVDMATACEAALRDGRLWVGELFKILNLSLIQVGSKVIILRVISQVASLK